MPNFTMYLKEVIESLYGTNPDEDVYEQPYQSVTFQDVTYGRLPVLTNYVPLGLGTYPLFDENYRKILNGKIIDEYYNREIGAETIDLFTFNIRKKMDQIMPYYNKMYESEQLDYTALSTMDIHSVGSSNITGTETGESKTDTTSETKSGSRGINSNFPQTQLSGNGDYATTGNDLHSTGEVDATSEINSDSTSSSDSSSDSRVTGYQGIASDLIMRYRNSLLNIDTMILADIEDCFMLLFDSGDEYFAHESRYGWY